MTSHDMRLVRRWGSLLNTEYLSTKYWTRGSGRVRLDTLGEISKAPTTRRVLENKGQTKS